MSVVQLLLQAEAVVSTTGKQEERVLGMVLVPLAQRKEVELQVNTCCLLPNYGYLMWFFAHVTRTVQH